MSETFSRFHVSVKKILGVIKHFEDSSGLAQVSLRFHLGLGLALSCFLIGKMSFLEV